MSEVTNAPAVETTKEETTVKATVITPAEPIETETVNAAEMAAEIINELDQAEAEAEAPVEETSMSAYLGDDNTLCTVRPRVLLTLSITDVDMFNSQAQLKPYLDSVNNGNGDVNVYNPFAKGADGKIAGALRDVLPEVFGAAELLAAQPLIIMGEASNAVSSIQRNLAGRIESLVHGSYNEGGTDYEFYSNDEPEEATDDVSDESPSAGLVAEVGINDLVTVTSWCSAESGEGENEIYTQVVTNINVNMPMLYNGENMKKSLYEIVKVIAGVVKSIGGKYAESVELAFALNISNEMMAVPSVLQLVNDMFEATDDNGDALYQYSTANAVMTGALDGVAQYYLSANTGNVVNSDSVLEAVFSHGGAISFIREL